jgi:hypothetical protein
MFAFGSKADMPIALANAFLQERSELKPVGQFQK